MTDLNDLYYFAKVVDHGGFAAAGRALGVPKSRLSRRVADLEASLDARLLQRTTRRLTLTEIGARYVEHCRGVIAAAESAQEAIDNARAVPSGVLRVSAPIGVAERQLASTLPKFVLAYPNLSVDLLVTNRRIDLIAEGIDVALRVRYPDEQDPNLVTRTLFSLSSFIVIAPKLLGKKRLTHPSELETLPAIGGTDDDKKLHWNFTRGDDTARIVLTPRYAADNFIVLREAAIAGLGATLLPEVFCAEAIAQKKLVRVLSDWALPVNVTHLVYPTRRGLSPSVRALVDFLVANLPVGPRR